MNWQILNTGAHNGRFNMDFDLELARKLQQGTGSQSLRFYRWTPYAVSLGFNQNIEDIDVDACAEAGIDVVRRPTGGRAILHAEELTYSVVMYADGRNVGEVYNFIGKALVHALQKLHPDISMGQLQPGFPELYRQTSSIPCFTSTARYEIQFRGNKLVGSAQRRFQASHEGEKEVVLQHGSILIGPEHRRLADFIRSDVRTTQKIGQTLADRTTELSTILQRTVSFDEVAELLSDGFEESWHITFENVLIESVSL